MVLNEHWPGASNMKRQEGVAPVRSVLEHQQEPRKFHSVHSHQPQEAFGFSQLTYWTTVISQKYIMKCTGQQL